MADIASVDVIGAKWARVTPTRTPDYENGVRAPRRAWLAATKAAQQAYRDGVAASLQKGSWMKGVTKAGDAAWSEGAIQKGVPRWGPGVQVAQPKYEKGFAPFRAAIAAVTLPPRFARRDPRNMERVRVVVEALVKAKEAAVG